MTEYSSHLWSTLQLSLVSGGALFGYYVGGFDGFLRTLVAFVIIDYITALALAFNERNLSSDIGFIGIFKKILIFALVMVANLIDNEIVYTGDMLRNAVVFFYLSNEGLSLLENCAALGMHIPEKIRIALLNFRNNKHDNYVYLEVPADHIDEVYKLKKVFEEPPGGMSNAMYDELTNGRDAANELHEQPVSGLPSDKPK